MPPKTAATQTIASMVVSVLFMVFSHRGLTSKLAIIILVVFIVFPLLRHFYAARSAVSCILLLDGHLSMTEQCPRSPTGFRRQGPTLRSGSVVFIFIF
jgi:hypothetical protein